MLVAIPTLFTSLLLAQAGTEPPGQNRPPNFSQVVGIVRIESQAAPTTVAVEKPILLTVRIQGEAEGRFVPRRNLLKIFPDDIADQFYVEPVTEKDRSLPAEKTWEFVYRLRPKSTDVKFIPGLKLVYYHPGRKKYATSFADPIALTVKPAAPPEVALPPVPTIVAPDSFFETASVASMLSWQARSTPPWKALVELLAVALVAFLVFSRNLFKQGERPVYHRAKLGIEFAPSVSQLRASMAVYLSHRCHLPKGPWTGPELVQRLRRIGLERQLLDKFQAFFVQCDQARFAPNQEVSIERLNQLCVDAHWLVDALEADPCVSRSA